MKRSSFRNGVIVVCCVAGIPATASAQWTETVLSPGITALGAGGAQQVGETESPNRIHTYAGMWSGTAASYVNLNPAGSAGSVANGASGTYQVGVAGNGAALWSGTAASYVNLSPAGANGSAAMAVSGTQEVGYASFPGGTGENAGLWTGTAGSWVNLNPAGNPWSEALGTSGNQQVGVFNPVYGAQASYAALWSGTASSFVDLNPTGAADSEAVATSGTHQVGEVEHYAALWSGTAGSFVNLNPAGAGDSEATGIVGDLQVGYAQFASNPISTPGYWTGTAASWVALPQISTNAYATGVSAVGDTVYIVGQDNGQAVVWTNPDFATPEPAPIAVLGLGALGLLLRRRT